MIRLLVDHPIAVCGAVIVVTVLLATCITVMGRGKSTRRSSAVAYPTVGQQSVEVMTKGDYFIVTTGPAYISGSARMVVSKDERLTDS